MAWDNSFVPVVYHGITATQVQKWVDNFAFLYARPRLPEFRVASFGDLVIAGTTVGGDLRLPGITGTIIDCGAYHDTPGVTGTEVIDIKLNGTTIMNTTKISVATGQKSSEDGGATQPVLTTTAYTANDILTIDVVTPHSGTPAKGLVVWIAIRET
jgi:hypothetical protein